MLEPSDLSMADSASTPARVAVRTLPVAAALAAIALVVLSIIRFDRVKVYLDSLSADGNVETFSPRMFDVLVGTARFAAVMLGLAAAMLFRSRTRLEKTISRSIDNTWR